MDVAALTGLTNVLNGLVAFLLGLYVTRCLDRWWHLVYDCLGNVWEELAGICMFTGTTFPFVCEQDEYVCLRGGEWLALVQLLGLELCLFKDVFPFHLLSKQFTNQSLLSQVRRRVLRYCILTSRLVIRMLRVGCRPQNLHPAATDSGLETYLLFRSVSLEIRTQGC